MASTADRKRKFLARRDKGRIVLDVEVDEVELSVALVDHGFIGRDDADDRMKLSLALSRLVELVLRADLSTLLERVPSRD